MATLSEEDPDHLALDDSCSLAMKMIREETERYEEWALLQAEAGGPPMQRTELGNSPLHFAAYHGHLSAVTVQLTAGADANLSRGFHDFSALDMAVFGGHLDVMRELLEHGLM